MIWLFLFPRSSTLLLSCKMIPKVIKARIYNELLPKFRENGWRFFRGVLRFWYFWLGLRHKSLCRPPGFMKVEYSVLGNMMIVFVWMTLVKFELGPSSAHFQHSRLQERLREWQFRRAAEWRDAYPGCSLPRACVADTCSGVSPDCTRTGRASYVGPICAPNSSSTWVELELKVDHFRGLFSRALLLGLFHQCWPSVDIVLT